MKKSLFLAIGLIALAMYPSKGLAWGSIGHRVIAEIAQMNLSTNAKKEVDKLFNNQPMAYWANWPDFIKSDTSDKWKHTSSWHYVNAPGGIDKVAFVDFVSTLEQENVYSEISKLANALKIKTASTEDKKYALSFLVHMVGDLHQPMHAGKAEDLGGNTIKVTWFGSPTNLHSVWDSKIIDSEKYSYTEYANILNILSKAEKEILQKGSLEDWAYESHALADKIYEMTPNDSQLSYEYVFLTKDIVELQLQKAGLRLARILNEVFK